MRFWCTLGSTKKTRDKFRVAAKAKAKVTPDSAFAAVSAVSTSGAALIPVPDAGQMLANVPASSFASATPTAAGAAGPCQFRA